MVMQARAEVHFIIDQAIQNMQALEAQARSTGQTVGTAFNASDADMANFNQALNTVGRNFMVTGGAITAGVGLAVKSFMTFEQQMSAVAAVANASAEEMEGLTQAALRIGQETSLNAVEVGQAMEILAKAGVPLQGIIDGIAEGAVRLSEATGVDITLSAETAAAAMTVFNYSAEETDRVMNVIAQSSNASMIGVEDWTTALQYAGPMVATLGYEIEDLAEWMVILGNNGIRGSVAATSLRNILTQLSDSTSPAREALEGMNISVLDTEGNMKGLDQIITEMVPHWNELDENSKVDLANNMFGVRGGPAFLAMMNEQAKAVERNGNAFDEAGESMRATGDIYTMSQMRMDNLAGSLERLRGSVETLAINFGSRLAPAIRVGVDMLDKVVDTIANLPGPIQTVIAAVAALSGGGLLLSGSFLLLLPQIMATREALAKLSGMRGVLTLLTGPIRAIGIALAGTMGPVLLIAGAAALIYAAWKYNLFNLREPIQAVANWLGDLWANVKQFYDDFMDVFGTNHKSSAELDISTNTDEDFDSYNSMEEGFGKKANLDIVTHPDDMFIEHIKDADGTVIDYEVKITSSLDGTEQTGRILSSSRDKNNPDLIHMEVQLESGETVQGTYNEIEGTFSEIPGNVNVGATFVGDAHYIKQETLPDGSKAWNIYEKDGDGAFGEIIESYTGAGGETYILIQGDDGDFWTTVDLATGQIGDPAILTIEGDPSDYNLTLSRIKSATGREVTVVIDGDGRPVTADIEEIIRDPNTGNKWIELTLANGEKWVAEVDDVTGSITLVREVTLDANTEPGEKKVRSFKETMIDVKNWLDEFGVQLDAFMRHDWDTFDWRTTLDLLGLSDFIGPIETVSGWVNAVWDKVHSDWGIVSWDTIFDITGLNAVRDVIQGVIDVLEYMNSLLGIESRAENDKQYDETQRGYNEKQDPTIIRQRHSATRRDDGTYTSMTPGDSYMMEIPATFVNSYNAGAAAVNNLFNSLGTLTPAAEQTVIDSEKMASSASYTDVSVMNASKGIESSSGLIGSSFGLMAQSVVTQSGLAATAGSTNFGILSQDITAKTLAAQVSASTNFGTLQSAAASRFAAMSGDTASKMSAIQNTVTSRSTQANTAGSAQFMQMQASVASRMGQMKGSADSQMSAIQSVVSSQTAAAQRNATSNFATMSSNVAGKMLGMQSATAVKLALMASDADTQGGKMASNLDTGASKGASNVSTQLAKISGYVAGAGANAAWSALIAGQNIGSSFASGMESMLGRIRAAANAMVAEADRAVRAKARIASPSKLFMLLGEYMGEGMELGILDKVGAVRSASEQLVHVPELGGGFNSTSGALQPVGAGRQSNVTNHYWITIPPDAWERMNADVAKSAKFVAGWKKPDAVSQYLGG